MSEFHQTGRDLRTLSPIESPCWPAAESTTLLKMDERRRELEARGAELFDFGHRRPARADGPEDKAGPRVRRPPRPASTRPWRARPALREAFCGWARRRHGVELDPSSEVLTARGLERGDLPQRRWAFLHPVARPDAGSSTGRRATRSTSGARTSPAGVGSAGGAKERERLQAAGGAGRPRRRRGYSGSTTPTTRPAQPRPTSTWRRVAEFCREHDILLFSDECYNDIYSGEPPPSILEITRKSAPLAFCSLSKRSGNDRLPLRR